MNDMTAKLAEQLKSNPAALRSLMPVSYTHLMKVKLQVIEKLPLTESIPPLAYQITDGKLDRWTYSPPGCEKVVETVFTAP